MDSKKQSDWSSEDPLKPRLGTMGRSIADRWAIRIMIKRLRIADDLLTTSALIGDLSAGIEINVDKTLRNELGKEYDSQLNTPALRQDCEDRLQQLCKKMKAISKNQ